MTIETVKQQQNGYLLNGTMSVPMAYGNREYELIKQWLAEGNAPEPEYTEAELQAKAQSEAEQAIQSHLDASAKLKGYDSIVSACSYAGYPNPFRDEAVAFGTWRANVWAYAYQELAKIETGERTIPTPSEFIAELPDLVLP